MSDLELGPLRVGIVGAGRLGLAFARALTASELEIVAATSHSSEGRSRAARLLDVPVFEAPGDLLINCDVVLICVPDDAAAAVIADLTAAFARLGEQRHPIRVIATSGVVGNAALQSLTDAGCVTCSIHPLRTIAEYIAADSLAGAPAAVTAPDEASTTFAYAFAHAAGMIPFDLPETGRPLHAAAAAIAANCTVTLQAIAIDLATAAGVPEPIARAAYGSLASSALDRVATSDPADALTGPIVRADVRAVEAQITAVARSEPRHEAVVRALQRSTIQLAFEHGRIDIDAASRMSQVVAATAPDHHAQPDDEGGKPRD